MFDHKRAQHEATGAAQSHGGDTCCSALRTAALHVAGAEVGDSLVSGFGGHRRDRHTTNSIESIFCVKMESSHFSSNEISRNGMRFFPSRHMLFCEAMVVSLIVSFTKGFAYKLGVRLLCFCS